MAKAPLKDDLRAFTAEYLAACFLGLLLGKPYVGRVV
jgi:hypothetical protein